MQAIVASWTGLLLLAPALAAAQAYPNKPVRMLVGHTGGNSDTLARLYAQKLGEQIGQQVVVDNRAGAGGNIAAELASKASADGYVLFFASLSYAINTSLYKNVQYDLVKDFAPVVLLSTSPYLLSVNPALPAQSLKELLALAKAKPGALNYASSGTTSYLGMALFSTVAGVQLHHIPYRSGAPATVALIGGQVEVAFTSVSAAIPHVRSGRLRGLAVSSAQRSAQAPDLPTISEAGVPGYEIGTWQGVMVPVKTPKEIVARLNADSLALLKVPEVRERYRALDADVIGSTPEQFGAYMKSEIARWAKVVKESGATAD
jgi:tripartite-type tricarboxylate transporter receptor subunit TctC